jgi:nicotinamidase-related amidase
MRAALLVIDLQKAYSKGDAATSMDVACEYINAVLPIFREKDLPVIWIQHISPAAEVLPGTEGFEFIHQLHPLEGEISIHKTYGNSFNKTDLKRILEENGVDTLILTGYCAENCVLSTYRGALDLDYTPIILRGAIASGNQENLKAVERISEIISFKALKKFLD